MHSGDRRDSDTKLIECIERTDPAFLSREQDKDSYME